MRGMTKDTDTFLDDIETTGNGEDLRQVLQYCSKHKLNMLSSVAKDVKNEKYGDSGSTQRDLRGQRSEVFTEDMLNSLFISQDIHDRWRYTFVAQLFLCLRPSEIRSVKLVPGYWRMRDGTEYDAFYIWNEKVDRDEYKPAPRFMQKVVEKWDALFEGRDRYTAAYANKVFSYLRDRLGYPWDDENPRKTRDGRTDYLYSNKSIRHTSKQLFMDATGNDPWKVAHHMHHNVESKVGSQGAYGRYDPDEWTRDLKRAFLPYYELIRPECEEVDSEGLFANI